MSFDWLQHAFLMVTIVVILTLILHVSVSKLKFFFILFFYIKVTFKNICLIMPKIPDLVFFTLLT